MPDIKKIVVIAMKKAGTPLKTAQIAEKTKLPKDEVSKVIKELKKTGEIVSPKNCFYALK